ncbi:hypothetical protein Tco_0793601 [Tanacetum coccineum]
MESTKLGGTCCHRSIRSVVGASIKTKWVLRLERGTSGMSERATTIDVEADVVTGIGIGKREGPINMEQKSV